MNKVELDNKETVAAQFEEVRPTSSTWSVEEERKCVWKLDMSLLPLTILGFFVLELDRSNISSALTSTLLKDLKIHADDVNLGNQLQLAAIVIFEIASNLVLQRVGASRWISFLSIAWGSVATFQAFCTGKASFYATRWLLGMFEAGYIPGCQYLLSLFYTRREMAKRMAIFYIGNYLAAGTGSLMAAGILKLEGKNGLAGWQWLFLVEGCLTYFASILFICLLPSSPVNTVPLCRIKAFNVFTPAENKIMHDRIMLDDPEKELRDHIFNIKAVLKALANPILWGHLLFNLVSIVPKGGLQLYSPTIIKSLGFSTSRANALNAVSSYGVIALSLILAWLSDRTGQKGIWIAVAGAYSMIFAGVQYSITTSHDKWLKYAILMCLKSGNAANQSLNDAWLSVNCKTPQQRSVGLALAVMGSNLGGLAGQQLFQSSDSPRYERAFLAILLLYAGALLIVAALSAGYAWKNKKAVKKDQEKAAELEAQGFRGEIFQQCHYQI